ncbi:MAG: hypothetical protein KDA84_00680, partial [Planctomycetaceae bacterium]|nr:hypothetical protein [Planctomycetaceae bacterium]
MAAREVASEKKRIPITVEQENLLGFVVGVVLLTGVGVLSVSFIGNQIRNLRHGETIRQVGTIIALSSVFGGGVFGIWIALDEGIGVLGSALIGVYIGLIFATLLAVVTVFCFGGVFLVAY